MKRIGTKTTHFRLLSGKTMNRGLKFGTKALSYMGDLTPFALAFQPELAPLLETAKLARKGMGALQKAKQMAKQILTMRNYLFHSL